LNLKNVPRTAGDCEGGISREHYVSQSVFPNQSIFVRGLDWCLDEAKEIRIETLTGKILCKRHNTALSELDSTAGLAFNSIQDHVATTNQRQDMPHLNWAPKGVQPRNHLVRRDLFLGLVGPVENVIKSEVHDHVRDARLRQDVTIKPTQPAIARKIMQNPVAAKALIHHPHGAPCRSISQPSRQLIGVSALR
jgi:hypothetical protein